MTTAVRSLPRVPAQTVALLVLLIGLFLASTGLIAIRNAQLAGLPTPLIVFIRLTVATLVFMPLTLPRHLPRIRRLPRGAWRLILLGAICFSADLMMFSEAIKHVNILMATLIGSLMPLTTALMERYLLKVPLSRPMVIGMGLAVFGGLVIALGSATGNASLGPRPLLGCVLATISICSASGYLIIGRKLRRRMPLTPYACLLFGASAIITMIVALPALLTPAEFTLQGFGWALIATLVAQLGAHPAFIFAIGSLSPTLVSIASQSIILFGSVLAFIFLRQYPGVAELAGGAIILAGVIFAVSGQRQS